jgi:hypothetical protein
MLLSFLATWQQRLSRPQIIMKTRSPQPSNSEWLTRKQLIEAMLKASGWNVAPFAPGNRLKLKIAARLRSIQHPLDQQTTPCVSMVG